MPAPTGNQIRQAVTDSVSKLMERSGRSAKITMNSDVIRGLGLTSEDGVELACMLQAALRITIPLEANPLIDDSGGRRRSRTIQQVCDATAAWAAEGTTQ